jgi:hypothetical protein
MPCSLTARSWCAAPRSPAGRPSPTAWSGAVATTRSGSGPRRARVRPCSSTFPLCRRAAPAASRCAVPPESPDAPVALPPRRVPRRSASTSPAAAGHRPGDRARPDPARCSPLAPARRAEPCPCRRRAATRSGSGDRFTRESSCSSTTGPSDRLATSSPTTTRTCGWARWRSPPAATWSSSATQAPTCTRGAGEPRPLGPVVLAPVAPRGEPVVVPAARARELCGLSLDWVEALPP